MSSRFGFWLIVLMLLGAAFLHFKALSTVPIALSDEEITNIRIAETARDGNIEVFYDLGGEGRDGLYHILAAAVTWLVGSGPLGYRLFSAWAGMLTLAMTYAVGRRFVGVIGGLCATGLLAISLWPNLLARHITPVTLLPLLTATVLFALSIVVPTYRRRRRRGDNTSATTALGVFLGFGLYVHPSGIMVLLFALAYILYMMRRRSMVSRRRRTYISFTLLITLIIAMPYVISSIRHPDLSGMNRLLGNLPTYPLHNMLEAVLGIFIRGDANPLHNLPGRPLLDPLSGLLIVGGVVLAALNWRQPRNTLLLIAVAFLSPMYLLAANTPDFANYAVALPVLALFFGLSIEYLIQRGPFSVQLGLGAALVLIVSFNIAWTRFDLFERWPSSPQVQAAMYTRHGQIAHHIDQTSGDIPTVVCGWQVNQSPRSRTLNDAQLISLMLNNNDNNIRYVDCQNAMVFTNGGAQQQIMVPDPALLENTQPPIQTWLAYGAFQTDAHPPDAIYILDVEEPLANTLGQLTSQPSVTFAPEAGGTNADPVQTPISFGDNLTFLGSVQPEDTTFLPGETVTIVTYWRVDGEVPQDLRLFTHILADPGASPPANADILNLSPAGLHNRDVFIQVTHVPLPESLPAGTYDISIGGYQSTINQRLNVLQNGEVRGTRLFLYPITVE